MKKGFLRESDARKWSWCDATSSFAQCYKPARDALAALRKRKVADGSKRGAGSSTAAAALTYTQFARVFMLYYGYVAQLRADPAGAPLPVDFTGRPTKHSYSGYALELESTAALVMLDLGRFCAGRARQDYALYRASDIHFIVDDDGTDLAYVVTEGDAHKTFRVNGFGQAVRKGPAIVVGAEECKRMRLLLGGRGGIDASAVDTHACPIVDRLFLRPRNRVARGDVNLWAPKVIGFHSWDPVRYANAHLQAPWNCWRFAFPNTATG